MPGAQLEDRGDEIDPGEQCADAGRSAKTEVVVDADIGREGELPTAAGSPSSRCAPKLPYQRGVDTAARPMRSVQTRRNSAPERRRRAPQLQRHDKVHQADDERIATKKIMIVRAPRRPGRNGRRQIALG